MGNWEAGIAQCQLAVERHHDGRARLGLPREGRHGRSDRGARAIGPAAAPVRVPFAAWFTALLADAVRMEGRLDDAEALCQEALEAGTAADFDVATGWAHQTLGRVAHARGDLGEALER